ncbi:citrate lyase subunit beta/citryl-CoA lyase [Rhodococcus rhodochrous J45]|uniref:Citrate lyase subunit beta/citryl-CoA lyase n=1 Tax=Rhodococcus rhodochrous J45 TaxID=935266 RepID=A0A562E381_RHORH|nr:citrate lyase subunit beta/citryl-CoA lyase [Rhodococcus rhodochrous J45]
MTPRSWLYVPGHRADRIDKALASDADAVVIDLEDAVPVDAKKRALDNAIAAVLSAPADRVVWLRLNAIGSQWIDDEIAALSAADRTPAGVRLPKADDPDTVAATGSTVRSTRSSNPLRACSPHRRSRDAIPASPESHSAKPTSPQTCVPNPTD